MSGLAGHIDEQQVAELMSRRADADARAALVEVCQPLAHRLARRFRGRGEASEDLVQIAMVGLVKAIDNFDPERGRSLLPYATAIIAGELKHHFRDRAAAVRTPRRVRARQAEVLQAIERLSQRLGRSPTVAEIATEAAISEEAVLEAYTASRFSSPASIEELATCGAPVAAPVDDDEFLFVEDWMTVAPALAELPERERQILYLRFYRELNQKQVAAAMGLSQAHVSRLISQALRRLRGITVT